MAISFKSLRQPETVEVAGILLPKRGCLTIAEEEAMRDLGAALEKELQGLNTLQMDLEIKRRVVTILIQSRLDRDWTLEKTKATQWVVESQGVAHAIQPDMEMLDSLYDFFMLEQRRGKPLEQEQPEVSGSKKKPTGTKSA